MPDDEFYYTVITGDIVGFTGLPPDRRFSAHRVIADSLQDLNYRYSLWPKGSTGYAMFRGDSFQCIITNTLEAMRVVMILISDLLRRKERLEFRIGMGVGTVEFLHNENVTLSIGEAFTNSGKAFDGLYSYQRLAIVTPWQRVDDMLRASIESLDYIISKWTPQQAEAIYHFLLGRKQVETSRILNITQSAVNQRLQNAGHYAVRGILDFYRHVMLDISPGPFNVFYKDKDL